MTREDFERSHEMYWDGAITAIDLCVPLIENDVIQYIPASRIKYWGIRLALWLLRRCDYKHW